jgi:HEAT repeat protein
MSTPQGAGQEQGAGQKPGAGQELGGLRAALASGDPSVRLQAALAAGTHPDPSLVEHLIERCAVDPDFFVRDMLTWALTRLPADLTVPRLLDEVAGDRPQARSQALHTLSKVGDPRGWSAITPELLRDPDDDVARAAWRAAVVLVPDGGAGDLARELAARLGRGSREVRLSLSRALVDLGEAAAPVLAEAAEHADDEVRAHAIATQRLARDPEENFDAALWEAERIVTLTGAPLGDDVTPA